MALAPSSDVIVKGLPEPAFYTPWMKGVYEVAPNLKPFGTDFGNGEADRKLCQFDRDWPRYFDSKRRSVEEEAGKYVAVSDLPPEVEVAAIDLIAARLLQDWPELFARDGEKLSSSLTGNSISLKLDSLCSVIQEDLAIVVKRDGRDWIAYINVCNPSHWLPTEKIGQSFFNAHVPVPGFEKINAVAPAMVDSMINRGPFVRFVWGLESDDQLNHHPTAPPSVDQTEWFGRQFEKGLFARVERQVLWPLPEVAAALFLIRPVVYQSERVRRNPEAWVKLAEAVASMSPEARTYKGIPDWLKVPI